MSDRGTETLKKIFDKAQEAPPPSNGTPIKLSELKKTAHQMGFVFIDGKLHNVIIDDNVPVMETKREEDKRQEPATNGTAPDYIKPPIYDPVKKAIDAGMNPVIFGPAGSGKSRLCKELAADLGKPFYTLSFSGGLRYSQVFGSQTLDNGSTEWKPAPLLQWITGPALILLDEIFSADPEVLLGLNSLLEPSTRNITTPAGTYNVHSECSFVACSNANGRQQSRQYTGTTRTDDSLLDRLIPPFFMNYDPKTEKAIIKTLVPEDTADLLTHKLETLRNEINRSSIPFDPSTRRLIAACKLVNAGFTPDEAFKLSFLSTLSQSELSTIDL